MYSWAAAAAAGAATSPTEGKSKYAHAVLVRMLFVLCVKEIVSLRFVYICRIDSRAYSTHYIVGAMAQRERYFISVQSLYFSELSHSALRVSAIFLLTTVAAAI